MTLDQAKQERLEFLRQQLAQGTYVVHPRIVVDAIIARGLYHLRPSS